MHMCPKKKWIVPNAKSPNYILSQKLIVPTTFCPKSKRSQLPFVPKSKCPNYILSQYPLFPRILVPIALCFIVLWLNSHFNQSCHRYSYHPEICPFSLLSQWQHHPRRIVPKPFCPQVNFPNDILSQCHMSQKYLKIQRFVPNTKCPKHLLSQKPNVPTTFCPNVLCSPGF